MFGPVRTAVVVPWEKKIHGFYLYKNSRFTMFCVVSARFCGVGKQELKGLMVQPFKFKCLWKNLIRIFTSKEDVYKNWFSCISMDQ